MMARNRNQQTILFIAVRLNKYNVFGLVIMRILCCSYLFAQNSDSISLPPFHDSTLFSNGNVAQLKDSLDTPLNVLSPLERLNSPKQQYFHDGKLQVQILTAFRKLENPDHTFSQTLWSQTKVTTDVNVKGMPVRFNYSGLSNDKLNLYDPKDMSVSFDVRNYTRQLKRNALKRIDEEKEKYLSEYFPGNINVSDSLKEYESLRQQMKSDKVTDSLFFYQNKIQEIKHITQDSIQSDSLTIQYQGKIDDYQKLKRRYQKLYEIKKKYVSLEDSLNSQLAKFDQIKQEVQKSLNPHELKNKLKQNNISTGGSSWMDKVRQFRLGGGIIDHTEFTSYGFYFDGFLGEYAFGNYPLLLAFGYQNPYTKKILGGSIPTFNGSKQYIAVRGGHVKGEGNERYVMLQRIKDRTLHSSSTSLERTNTVLSFLEREKLNTVFSLESEQAISWSEYDNAINDFDLGSSFNHETGWENFSGAIGLNAKLEELHTTCSVKFRHVGEKFITLANPFLISNSQAVQVSASHELLRQRIVLRNEWSHESIARGMYSQSIIRSVVTSNLIARVSNKIILNLQFSPIRQKLKSSENYNEQRIKINRWSATANISHSIFHRSVTHTISYLNFNSELPEEQSYAQDIYSLTEIQLSEVTFLNGQFHCNFIELSQIPRDMHYEALLDFIMRAHTRLGIGITYDNYPLSEEKYGLKAEAEILFFKSLTWKLISNYRSNPHSFLDIVAGDLFFQTSFTYGIPLSLSKMFNSKNPKS